jgi:hypothetical protein
MLTAIRFLTNRILYKRFTITDMVTFYDSYHLIVQQTSMVESLYEKDC